LGKKKCSPLIQNPIILYLPSMYLPAADAPYDRLYNQLISKNHLPEMRQLKIFSI